MQDNSVIIVQCKDYKRENVAKAMTDLFAYLEKDEKFFVSDKTYFIKPNILNGNKPELAATTHPEVLYHIAKRVTDENSEALCGDSPNIITSKLVISSIYKSSGITKAIEEANGKMVSTLEGIEVIGGEYLPNFKMLKSIYTSDYTINVAKAKTHAFAGYTGVVKNLFGVIPGAIKGQMHLRYTSATSFVNAMIDISETVNADLHIVDAIIGMQGNGPSSGTPKQLGVLVAGKNPYAVDEVVIALMGLNEKYIPQVKEAQSRGLTPPIEDIKIIGGNLQSFKTDPPFIPATYKNVFINAALAHVMPNKLYIKLKKKPIINHLCIGCGVCETACPPDAIVIIDGKACFDYKKCIKCYCCQELCPKRAIVLDSIKVKTKVAFKRKTL